MTDKQHSGIIAWFAQNPVAANLLMIVILTIGLVASFNVQRELMPKFELDGVHITMAYPGAAPEEVELGIVSKIEEAIKDVDGMKRVHSTTRESLATIYIQAEDDTDVLELMEELKNRIDSVQNFPEQAEKPIVEKFEIKQEAIRLQLWGDLNERDIKEYAKQLKMDLMNYPEVSFVDIQGGRDYEIAIEVSEHQLRRYHLTLGQIAKLIRDSSVDLPAGSVRTENGDIMLRTTGQAYRQADFERLIIKTNPDGTRLTLGDIAKVDDGFEDVVGFAAFNNRQSVGIVVYALGQQDVIETATIAKQFAAEKSKTLPEGVHLTPWSDTSYYLQGRLDMMIKNLTIGALLVFIVLALFLEIQLAFWVMVGIPVCFLGALACLLLPGINTTLNMVSIFGFILVLGIVVDDAIIIGESAFSIREKQGHSVDSIIAGTNRVAIPATFGVLTTIVAFAPTLFVQGVFAAMPKALGWVVILCLIFSLIESKWILPAHLAHSRPRKTGWIAKFNRIQGFCNKKLNFFVTHKYRPFIEKCIRHRYLTLSIFLCGIILSAGLLAGGVVRFVMQPEVPSDFLQVELKMVDGTPERRTLEVMRHIQGSLEAVEREYIEESGDQLGFVDNVFAYSYNRINGFTMGELRKSETRSIHSDSIINRWREKIGDVSGAKVLSISAADNSMGAAISFDLMANDFKTLQAAAGELESKFRSYQGLYDIRNGASATSDEIHLDILPSAEALGLTLRDLGAQVRHAFYGAEAQRIQRNSDEIKVMVRYPKEDRRSTNSLDSMFIRTPGGDSVPFNSVATIESKPGFNEIQRIDFRRAVSVSAEANKEMVEPSRISGEIVKEFLPGLMQRHPGLSYKLSGGSDEERKMLTSMGIGFALALFGIYALLAIPTKSYMQPLIIMGVIPFGIIGAIVGHWITGYAFSMMSITGVIALSGVVVNDSLILVDFTNRAVNNGTNKVDAVINAGTSRFRAILLTSLTTFFGLSPMLAETSIQAKAMVPMAISLGFGIIFATVITLLLVPCLYIILQDLNNAWRSLWDMESEATPG